MRDPKRVLQVFASLNRGGAETALMTYYRKIDRTRLQYDFVTHSDQLGDFEAEIVSLGGRVHRVPRLTPFNLYRYAAAWRQLLSQHQDFIAVHGHYYSISSVYLTIAKLRGFRTIAHAHNKVPGVRGAAIKVLNAPLRIIADVLLACSADAGEFLFGSKAQRSGRVAILRNAIDAKRFDYSVVTRERVRRELGVENVLLVGNVGSLTRQKNHRFLLEILVEMRRRRPDATLLLVGRGALEQEIRTRVDELKLNNHVRFLGSRDDVAEILQAVDVFCFPSLFEGLGIAAVEAQAAGLPTVVSDRVPSEAALTDLVTGISLGRSAADWASVIIREAENRPRRSTLEEVRRAGYDIDLCTAELESLYLGHGG